MIILSTIVVNSYLLPAANLSKLPMVDGDQVRGLTAAREEERGQRCHQFSSDMYWRERGGREREREREREN